MWLNDEFGMLNDEFSPAAIRSFELRIMSFEWLNKIGCTSSNSNKFDYFRFAQSFSLRFDVELFSVE